MNETISLVRRRRSELHQALADLGRLVVAALERSVQSLVSQDLVLARDIIDADREVNQRRRLLEQECLVTLAAYQPAGADLRAIGACMELVSELERIGDYAADVARILQKQGLTAFPRAPLESIAAIAQDAIQMLTDALEVFTAEGDEASARNSIAREEQVDRDEETLIQRLLATMSQDPSLVTTGTHLLWIVHNYERVADRATNIAERAIFVASGQTPELDQ
jgi:phosphate transport system protein